MHKSGTIFRVLKKNKKEQKKEQANAFHFVNVCVVICLLVSLNGGFEFGNGVLQFFDVGFFRPRGCVLVICG